MPCCLALIRVGIILPAHILHEILGSGDERGAVVAYQVVAALAVVVAYPAREGEDIPTVGLRNIAGDESSAMSGALYQDAGIRHSRHDAVAAHEVYFVGVGLGKELGEQSALLYHSRSRIPVADGVEVIKTMSQHAYGFVAVGEGLAVCHDIHAVGQVRS